MARFKNPSRGTVKIGIVGKYVHLKDSYKSLHEALVHGGLASDCRVELTISASTASLATRIPSVRSPSLVHRSVSASADSTIDHVPEQLTSVP